MEEESAKKDDPERQKKLSKLNLNLCVIKMKLEKMDKDIQAQLSKAPDAEGCRLVCDAAYPGTTVTIHRSSFRVKQVERECTFRLVNGFVDSF